MKRSRVLFVCVQVMNGLTTWHGVPRGRRGSSTRAPETGAPNREDVFSRVGSFAFHFFYFVDRRKQKVVKLQSIT